MTSTRELPFRLLNVFAIGDEPFSGNPLCVFEEAAGLTDDEMQGLARQLNLSETTFVSSPRPTKCRSRDTRRWARPRW